MALITTSTEKPAVRNKETRGLERRHKLREWCERDDFSVGRWTSTPPHLSVSSGKVLPLSPSPSARQFLVSGGARRRERQLLTLGKAVVPQSSTSSRRKRAKIALLVPEDMFIGENWSRMLHQ
jgi:hypothetical protein